MWQAIDWEDNFVAYAKESRTGSHENRAIAVLRLIELLEQREADARSRRIAEKEKERRRRSPRPRALKRKIREMKERRASAKQNRRTPRNVE